MPTARIYNNSSIGLTLYDGTPDQKISLSFSFLNALEFSIFETKIRNIKDKGLNIKLRLKEEGNFPAVAIGINDLTSGFYNSEYIVASYGVNTLDFHLGIGWGNLNGSEDNFKNPFGYINDSFKDRTSESRLDTNRYFSGERVSLYYGFSFALNDSILVKLEYDTTLTPGNVNYESPNDEFTYGFDFLFGENFILSASNERGSFTSSKLSYKKRFGF